MKILKYLLLTIVGIVVAILVIALFVPKHYKVERSIDINASQETVMAQAKSLKNSQAWNPWSLSDPNQVVTYAGTDGEEGSSSSWKGEKTGEGTQTITKLTSDRVESRLDFKKPMESSSSAFVQTQVEGDHTKVTWGMEGDNKYPFNFMCLFMDNMLGKEFDKGLANLKVICEKPEAAAIN